MKQGFWWVLAALAAIAVEAAPAIAASTLVFTAVPVDGARPADRSGRVYAGSQAVMTLGGRGAQSAADALEVARRLNALAEAGLRPGDLTVQRGRNTRIIAGRGSAIVTIDRTMAAYHKSDVDRLARRWTDNLAAAFGRPYLSATPLVVPVGEARSTTVRGAMVGAVRVQSQAPIASAEYDAAQRTLRVFAHAPGQTEIIIADDHSLLRLPLRAARYAGRVPVSLSAAVTGDPASREIIYRAAEAAVAASLALEPGAWATINPRVGDVVPAAPGSAQVVPVHVSAAGYDYLPYRAQPAVTIRNQPFVRRPADILMVSNSPERILAHGLWYEGAVQDYQTARLLYHHVNSTGAPSDLVIELWNLSDRPSQVHVIVGKGGPSPDEAWAGHRAATEFLSHYATGTGWVAEVPGRTAVPILSQWMSPSSIASGVIELHSLAPGDMRVRCYLHPSRSLWLPYPVRSYTPSPVLGKWLYPQPRQEISARYVVGGQWAFVTLGHPAIPGLLEGDRLAGNYGVLYDIALELVNPTAEPARVDVLLEAGGGPARAALLVDGRPAEAALIRRNEEVRIARYQLAPGESRSVHIQTTPQGGSNYPVRLFARAS